MPDRPRLWRREEAVSPIVGEILMISATVLLVGAVYAGFNAYSGSLRDPPPPTVWRAHPLDLDEDGRAEAVRLVYLSGPPEVPRDAVRVAAASVDGEAWVEAVPHEGAWRPGDFAVYRLASPASAPQRGVVTVVVAERTVLEQLVALEE